MTGLKTWIAALFVAVLPLAGGAAVLGPPTGEIVLTVSGNIGVRNDPGGARFDLDMLQTLPQTTYATTTIWTEGVQTFTGVLLSDLLTAVDAAGSGVNAFAINDYMVEIPGTDAVPNGALVAYLLDGEPMSIRDKGPLWIVYPFDSNDAYQSEVIYSRSIWQLDRLAIAP